MKPNCNCCLDVGSSDRYAAVLKSHVRRYLNEGHDVSTANQFVAACASYGGVKNVQVFECQLASSRTKYKAKVNDITKLHNFIYEINGIRSYRVWNIGIGKMLILDGKENVSSKVNSLVCVNTSTQIIRLINSPINDRSNNIVSSVAKDSGSNDQHQPRNKLFFCNYEGCICRFVKYGNFLRHLADGNHIERVEKLSMKDLAMITYKSKLDTADNQELLCLELERINFNRNDYTHIPSLEQGWALPLPRKVQRLTAKVRKFLKEKFDDGQANGIRWQPEAVVHEMKHSKSPDTGHYLFHLSELVKVGTVRSFFSRQKANKDRINDPKIPTFDSSTLTTAEQDDNEADNEGDNQDELFEEQLEIDLELQFADIRLTVIKGDVTENNLATVDNDMVTATSKRALSSLENENSPYTKKSSRIPRKKD